MIAAAAPMADSGSCCAISYAMDTLPASRCCHSGSRTKTRSRGLTRCQRKGPLDGFEVWDHARFVWLPSAVTLAPISCGRQR